MLVVIPKVLGREELDKIHSLLKKATFVDGRLSAGGDAKKVKNNEEISPDSPLLNQLNSLVMPKLIQHPMYQTIVFPIRVAKPFYSRYTKGMSYGEHVDSPIMGPVDGRYRSDISSTIFLNDPDQYEGGELLIQTPYGGQSVKLAAGDAIVYPSSSIHQVGEVTSGERLVVVTWAQCTVRDPQQRELLFQLYKVNEGIRKVAPDSQVAKETNHVYVNLMRMWSDM